MKMVEYQVTLFSEVSGVRPVSSIVRRSQTVELTDKVKKQYLVNDGVSKICNKRNWNQRNLSRLGYTKVKVRKYEREKVEAEKVARYEAIKEAKYVSGEWVRPKGKGMSKKS